MNRLLRVLRGRRGSYQPLDTSPASPERDEVNDYEFKRRFSIIEYLVFMILGMAMLWAWNMFLAAGPYFQKRFKENKSLLDNFQAAELSVSTLTNLLSMMILTKLQASASYPRRIFVSLFIYLSTFILLSISTQRFDAVSPQAYFGFLIVMIFSSALATGFMQNGTFAYASAYRRPEYMQAVMFGQAIAGVLPPVAQIATVLSVSGNEQGQQSSKAALAYFLTATLVACFGILSFSYLSKHHNPYRPLARGQGHIQSDAIETDRQREDAMLDETPLKSVPLHTLAWKLRYPATAIFITFGVTMAFPVFTQEIISVNPSPPPILRKASFIPLALLIWNIGDLIGRMAPLWRRASLATNHKVLLILSIGRFIWIPLYLSCNIQKPEVQTTTIDTLPTVRSDAFYLVAVQLCFGLTNGYLGSCCMMGAGSCVADDEKEACGSFMGMMLVFGLAAGSFCSFFINSG